MSQDLTVEQILDEAEKIKLNISEYQHSRIRDLALRYYRASDQMRRDFALAELRKVFVKAEDDAKATSNLKAWEKAGFDVRWSGTHGTLRTDPPLQTLGSAIPGTYLTTPGTVVKIVVKGRPFHAAPKYFGLVARPYPLAPMAPALKKALETLSYNEADVIVWTPDRVVYISDGDEIAVLPLTPENHHLASMKYDYD